MRTGPRRLAFLIKSGLTLLLCALAGTCAKSDGTVLHGSMVHDQVARTYRIYLPADYGDKTGAALLIALHGSGSTGDSMATCAEFEGTVADADNCIVVYPDAYEANWNDGRAVAGIPAYDLNIDDVGFISDLIAFMIVTYGVDPGRVYVAGISNGAMMTYRLACEIPGQLAACACVAGAIPLNVYGVCEPSARVPLVVFNGTDDPYVPWNGGVCGTTEDPLGYVVSVPQSVQFWASRNSCGETPETALLEDAAPNDGTTVTRYVYAGADSESDVVFYGIEGGGHTWPGGPASQTLFDTGPVSYDIDATAIIWAFFNGHSRS